MYELGADGTPLAIPVATTEPVLFVIQGVFRNSPDGCQDGARRWHDPYRPNSVSVGHAEPYCVSCGMEPAVESLFAVLFDGKPATPLDECPFDSTYLVRVTPNAGVVSVRIADWQKDASTDPYSDNSGRLLLRLVPGTAADHGWDVEGDALPAGLVLSEAVLKVGEPFPGASALLPPVLTVTLPVPADAAWLEVQGGLAVGPGLEQDPAYVFNYAAREATWAAAPIAVEGCTLGAPISLGWGRHRTLWPLGECTASLVVSLLIPDAFGGFHVRLRKADPGAAAN